MERFKIGIIDDAIEEESLPRKNRFRKKTFLEKIELVENLEDIVKIIVEEKYDGLIIDQKLNTENRKIGYDGTDISKEVIKKKDIPFFFWSSNIGDIEQKCTSNEVNLVFENNDISAGIDILKESSPIMKKLILKIEKQKEEIKMAEEELLSLTEDQVERRIELDNFISDKLSKTSDIEKARKIINTKRINELLDSFEAKIKELKSEKI